MVETVSANRYMVVMSSSVGKIDSRSAPGMYNEINRMMTDRLMLTVSSTSSSNVGSGTINIAMMAMTTTASTMSEYLLRNLLPAAMGAGG